jgi:hypothetical protein
MGLVSVVVLADCPEDGGKWALYCEHKNSDGVVVGCGILQDSNKQRLGAWRMHSAEWCPFCQEEGAK